MCKNYIMDIKYQDEILKLSRLIISCSSLLVCIFISCGILGIIFGITGDYHVIPTIFLLSSEFFYFGRYQNVEFYHQRSY